MMFKARIKETGETIDVVPVLDGFCDIAENRVYKDNDIEILGINCPDPEATISGWVARDGDGRLLVFRHNKPQRETMGYWDSWDDGYEYLPPDFFPSLTWEDEPIEVDIIIKPKKQ